MISSIVHILSVNAAILLVVVVLYDLAIRVKQINLCDRILHGFVIAFWSVVLMSLPWSYTGGINIDTRTILLCVSGLFFGTVPTLIAVVVSIVYRLLIGGMGATAGILMIVTSACAGLGFHYYFAREKHKIRIWHLYLLGLVVHTIMLALIFLMPLDIAWSVFRQIFLPVIVIYPILTALIGYLLLNHFQRNLFNIKLHESELNYRQLYDRAPIPYQSLAEDGTYLSVNEAWLSTLGYQADEVLGRNFSEFIHPDDATHFQANFPLFKEIGRIDGVEFRLRKKDGEFIFTSFNGRIVRDAQGKFRNTQCIFEDQTQRRLTEQALNESMNSLQKLFDNAPMGIFRTTTKGRAFHINRGFARIIGFDNVTEAYNYISDPDTPFFVDDELRNRWVEILRVNGRAESFQMQAYTRTGDIVWILLNASLGEPLGDNEFVIDGFCIDISGMIQANQELKNSEATMRGVFEYMASGCGIYEVLNDGARGSDYVVKFFNREALFHEGKQLSEVVGQSLLDLRPQIEEFGLIQVLQKVFQTGKAEYLPPSHYKDENFDNWYDNWVFKLPSGEVVTIYNDVTERVLYQDNLKDSNIRLENMVQERTKQLQDINRELEDFTHSVAHDLRAPLRSIQGFSTILAEEYMHKLDAEGNRLLDIIVRNIATMDKLILDMLSLSKLSRTELKKVPTDMNIMVKDCLKEAIDPRELELFEVKLNDLPQAICDPVLIKHVWMNLLSNAIKYTLPQESKKIEIGAVSESDKVVYYVRDSGVGFNEKYVEKAFQLFQRLHGTEKFDGSGVGLAIVYRLIARHEGKVWAKSKINEGSEFFFSLSHSETQRA